MSDLSQAAQAVWTSAWEECPVECGDIEGTRRRQIAAALRAAADQVVPADALYARSCCEFVGEQCRANLLAIAAELEGAND